MSETIYAAVREWLFKKALPFWAEHGIDRTHGGYVEQLRLDGTNPLVNFKRTRVIGRQIYVFSHAALLGIPDGIALAQHGLDFLTTRAWLGPTRGWARLVDREGRVMDPTPDLYDLSFVLLALSWSYCVTTKAETLDWAYRTLDFVTTQMHHPSGLGFFNEKPAQGPRRQNPHMHLLEAALVALEATGDARFAALVDELVELFCTYLFDPATWTLGEYFNEDWSRIAGDKGRAIEPGHHFEWAWILSRCKRITGRNLDDWVRQVVTFAEDNGVDARSGLTFNAVRDDGVVLDRGSRVWPNTERIQAAVAMFEVFGRDPRPVFEETGRLLLRNFLSHSPDGTWIDQVGADGGPCSDKIPTSTLYHIVIAFAEMLRVEEAVKRAFPD